VGPIDAGDEGMSGADFSFLFGAFNKIHSVSAARYIVVPDRWSIDLELRYRTGSLFPPSLTQQIWLISSTREFHTNLKTHAPDLWGAPPCARWLCRTVFGG